MLTEKICDHVYFDGLYHKMLAILQLNILESQSITHTFGRVFNSKIINGVYDM